MLHYGPLCSIRTWPTDCFIKNITVLLEYLDLSILAGRAQLRFGGPSPSLVYVTEKYTWCLTALLSLEACYFIKKYAYYASIMFEACLLCQHYA